MNLDENGDHTFTEDFFSPPPYKRQKKKTLVVFFNGKFIICGTNV